MGEHPHRKLILGSACVATAAAVAYVVVRKRAHNSALLLPEAHEHTAGAPTKAATAAMQAPQSDSATQVTWESLAIWATSLRKKDAGDLPTLLSWTERLLTERPADDALLSPCLTALQILTSPVHPLADQVANVALLASRRDLDKSLELLNVLFKDRRHRGPHADNAVVDLAISTLKHGIAGSVSRGANQRACRLVNFLSEDPASRALLVSRGGATVMLDAMDHFASEPGVLVEGCSCIRSLAEEPILDIGRAVESTIVCMRGYINSGDLQWRALAALHTLPHWDSGDAAMIVAELACAAATRHPRHDTVVEWVAKVLYRLARNNASGIRNWLKLPAQKVWLAKFREESYHVRKPNKEVDKWVAELSSFCRK